MDVCRTCLSVEGLTPIFTGDEIARRSNELFNTTGVKIEPNDGLPQQICTQCHLLINEAVRLREQSALSEATLLQSGYRKPGENKPETNDHDYDNFNIEDNINTDSIKTEIDDVEDKKHYYCRNTPLNRMVTVKEDTYKVKVEIGNVVWESEIKKEKKPSKNGLKKSLRKKYGRKEVKRKQKVESEIKIENDFNGKGEEDDKSDDIGLFDHLLIKKRRTMTKEKLASFTDLAVKPFSKKGPVKCKICHKELMNFRNFLNHCKIHFAAENTCETCGKEFVNRNSMRYHQMRLHGAEKMHKCKYCDYKGVDVYQMKNHERRVHTGEKPFICNECGVSFYLRAGIAQHMRKHFAVKSIQCDRCPAMFRSRNELTTHRNKVHLMHYTYYCYLCPEKYRAVGTVRKHLYRRHGVPKDRQLQIPVSKVKKNCDIMDGPPMWQEEMHRDGLTSY